MAIVNHLLHPDLLAGVKSVVFDCDGVLIDSINANIYYYGQIKAHLGLDPLSPSETEYVHMHTHDRAIKHIVPPDRLDAAWEFIRNFDSTVLNDYMTRSDGVLEFLWWLRSKEFKLAVNTSRKDSMDFILNLMDLEGFFSPVITSGLVVSPKPHPEGMFMIMRQHGVLPHEIAYIGDSKVDQKTAEASGVRFWAYKDQTLDAKVHIESFWEIKAAMQRCY